MRANSAKHSVITIEEGSQQQQDAASGRPIVRQISWRRRSSACEQGLLCGGGMAAASTVPFVSVPFVTRVIQQEESGDKKAVKK